MGLLSFGETDAPGRGGGHGIPECVCMGTVGTQDCAPSLSTACRSGACSYVEAPMLQE